MSRALPEWIGKHDDEAVPARVQVRIFKAFKGVCPECTRKMQPGAWQLDHIKALINGGEHRETNLWPLCTSPCHSQKTKADLAEKSKNYRTTAKHIGVDLTQRQKMRGQGFRKASPQNTASRPINKWMPA